MWNSKEYLDIDFAAFCLLTLSFYIEQKSKKIVFTGAKNWKAKGIKYLAQMLQPIIIWSFKTNLWCHFDHVT